MTTKNRNVVFYGSGETNNQKRKTNNPLYRTLLIQHWLAYSKVPNNNKLKEAFVWNHIVQPIIADGGHFLNERGEIIDEKKGPSKRLLITKVCQALRDLKKKANNMPKSQLVSRKGYPDEEIHCPALELTHLLCNTAQEIRRIKDDIKFLKESFTTKVADIALESIVTQEELVMQCEIGRQKDNLILSQNAEIRALKEAMSLLKGKNEQVTHESKE